MDLFSLSPDRGIKLGLSNMRRLTGALRLAVDELRCVHIAGTNGKGSLACLIEAGLRASGLSTGLYTSPHLVSPSERVVLDGRPVGEADLAAAGAEVDRAAAAAGISPTFFEVLTAAALLIFLDRRPDVIVLEAGLGGRLDSTNIVTPLLTAITCIDIDHVEYLGEGLAAIAAEKAGIVKPGVPLVTGERRPELVGLFASVCSAAGSTLHTIDRDFGLQTGSDGSWRYRDRQGADVAVTPPDIGVCAGDSLALALRSLDLLGRAGLPVAGLDTCAARLAAVRLPGRWQQLRGRPPVVLDSAHNPAAQKALARQVGLRCAGRPVAVVYASMADKDFEGSLAALAGYAGALFCPPLRNPRAAPPDLLAAAAGRLGLPAKTAADLPLALELARRAAGPEGVVLVTGSNYLVGEAMRCLDVPFCLG